MSISLPLILALSGSLMLSACTDKEAGDSGLGGDGGDGGGDDGSVGDPDDQDGDGVTATAGDCDDGDASIFPGADEVAGDGIDQDCDGTDANPHQGFTMEGYTTTFVSDNGGVDTYCEYGWEAVGSPTETMCMDCTFGFDVVNTWDGQWLDGLGEPCLGTPDEGSTASYVYNHDAVDGPYFGIWADGEVSHLGDAMSIYTNDDPNFSDGVHFGWTWASDDGALQYYNYMTAYFTGLAFTE
jgi:hypothetical protein